MIAVFFPHFLSFFENVYCLYSLRLNISMAFLFIQPSVDHFSCIIIIIIIIKRLFKMTLMLWNWESESKKEIKSEKKITFLLILYRLFATRNTNTWHLAFSWFPINFHFSVDTHKFPFYLHINIFGGILALFYVFSNFGICHSSRWS